MANAGRTVAGSLMVMMDSSSTSSSSSSKGFDTKNGKDLIFDEEEEAAADDRRRRNMWSTRRCSTEKKVRAVNSVWGCTRNVRTWEAVTFLRGACWRLEGGHEPFLLFPFSIFFQKFSISAIRRRRSARWWWTTTTTASALPVFSCLLYLCIQTEKEDMHEHFLRA